MLQHYDLFLLLRFGVRHVSNMDVVYVMLTTILDWLQLPPGLEEVYGNGALEVRRLTSFLTDGPLRALSSFERSVHHPPFWTEGCRNSVWTPSPRSKLTPMHFAGAPSPNLEDCHVPSVLADLVRR